MGLEALHFTQYTVMITLFMSDGFYQPVTKIFGENVIKKFVFLGGLNRKKILLDLEI